MSSAHSASTPEPSKDTSAETSIWENPDDRPYLEVISALKETTEYPVKPGTTLALKQGKGLPGLPNHYKFFFANPDRSSHDDSASIDPYASSTDPHRNDSEVFWHPEGRRGPKERVTQLPFSVATDMSGTSKIHDEQDTVPLPPTECFSEAWWEEHCERQRANAAAAMHTIDRIAETNKLLDAAEEEREGDTNKWGYKVKR
jgi:hypothetical protein